MTYFDFPETRLSYRESTGRQTQRECFTSSKTRPYRSMDEYSYSYFATYPCVTSIVLVQPYAPFLVFFKEGGHNGHNGHNGHIGHK